MCGYHCGSLSERWRIKKIIYRKTGSEPFDLRFSIKSERRQFFDINKPLFDDLTKNSIELQLRITIFHYENEHEITIFNIPVAFFVTISDVFVTLQSISISQNDQKIS